MEKEALQYLHGTLKAAQSFETDPDIQSQLMAVPESCRIESLEQYQDRPNRIRSSVSMGSVQSFINYVSEFGLDETVVYYSVTPLLNIHAVIDHYTRENPSWEKHKVSYVPEFSIEWKAWSNMVGSQMTQVRFAEFLEERLDEIVMPEPADVLGSVLKFQNAAEKVTFPHRISISIPVYENEPAIQAELRVRYRSDNNGVLTFMLTFVKDMDTIIRGEGLKLMNWVIEQVEGVKFYQSAR